MKRLIKRIKSSLTKDLLNAKWSAKSTGGLSGHCYVAAEALWHLLGGREAGWTPHVLNHHLWPEGLDPGETHWFLRNGQRIADPTAEQFDGKIAYDRGKPCGFLTKLPSKRARIVLERVNEEA